MLRERLSETLKTAMKAGDKPRVSTIRLVQAALKDKDIEARGAGKGPLPDDDILGLMQKMIKQRQESLAIYEANARPELAETERQEIAIIGEFLPQQLGEAETADAVAAAIVSTGAVSMKDMGKVVAALRGEYAGRMDFAKASGMVKAKLAGG